MAAAVLRVELVSLAMPSLVEVSGRVACAERPGAGPPERPGSIESTVWRWSSDCWVVRAVTGCTVSAVCVCAWLPGSCGKRSSAAGRSWRLPQWIQGRWPSLFCCA